MKLQTNDTITWSSAAGKLTGVIANIVLAENAKNETIAWLHITVRSNKGFDYTVCMCASDSYLKMMKVEKV